MSVLFFTCFSIKYRRKITALQVYIFSFVGIIFLLLLFFQAKLKTSRTESSSLGATVFHSEGFSVFYAILACISAICFCMSLYICKSTEVLSDSILLIL